MPDLINMGEYEILVHESSPRVAVWRGEWKWVINGDEALRLKAIRAMDPEEFKVQVLVAVTLEGKKHLWRGDYG